MDLLTSHLSPSLIFLAASLCMTLTSAALRRLGKLHAEELISPFFFYYPFNAALFKERKWEALMFSLGVAKHLFSLCFAFTAFFFFLFHTPFPPSAWWLVEIATAIIAVSLLGAFLAHLASSSYPKLFLHGAAPLCSFFLFLSAPITVPFFIVLSKLIPSFLRKKNLPSTFRIRDKIEEILHESDLSSYLDANEQKLVLSIVSFKERIVREVMVPRINLFSLSLETTLKEACKSFLQEGYSRIPIYRENVDNIIGVLYYKDLFNTYVNAQGREEHLSSSIEQLVKPVLYTPETKKISHLLQEFRSKKMHLAIVVDEYGGTEGIVTIEDILEELVGEISDEYDKGEEPLFAILPGGGWIVDARMSIIDIEGTLGIKVPQSPEYDTLGGYIFHRAGAIPSQGWRLHYDTFELEVLSSNERCIEKIRITPQKEA